MNARDLEQLGALFDGARAVVPMIDVHNGDRDPDVIGLRHDVDDNAESLNTAVKMACWEAEHGYRSTYFILHTASYWQDEQHLRRALEQIASLDHEIGIHANAIAAALRGDGEPAEILAAAIEQLRGYGYPIVGVAPHGDELCHRSGFVNDEMFSECARPEMGAPDRVVTYGARRLKLEPTSLSAFGLEYETYRLPRGRYLSDSGGTWNTPIDTIEGAGQLHVLQHPDWWQQAF